MQDAVLERIRALGIELPEPSRPLASYVPVRQAGDVLWVSGQLPMVGGRVAFQGLVGRELTVEEGARAARACAVMALAQLAAVGPLADLRIVRVGGFVACGPDFTEHPEVVNGASDLLLEVMGEAGRHARAAVGVASLPRGAAVEIEVQAVRMPAGG